jgi:SAM-dependent methyltransferase
MSYIGTRRTLEIGSGTGRLTVPLLNAGADLYGIEGSKAMFQTLKAKLPAEKQHRFIRWDARVCPYPAEDGAFACAIVPFSTFGLIHNKMENIGENRIFREVSRLLSPKGMVIINDYRTGAFDEQKLDKPENPWNHEHFHPEHGRMIEEQTSRYVREPNRVLPRQVIRERRTRFIRLRDGKILEEHFERLPLWDINDFPILGRDAGFSHIKAEPCGFHEDMSVCHIFEKV